MSIAPGEIAALAAIAFLGSVVFGITGFGAALVTIPLATHLVSLPFALALYVLMDLANAFRIGFENPKLAVRREWTRLVPTIVLGTVAGVTLLVNLPRQAATLALGIFVVAFALYSLTRHPDDGLRLGSVGRDGTSTGTAQSATTAMPAPCSPRRLMSSSHVGLANFVWRVVPRPLTSPVALVWQDSSRAEGFSLQQFLTETLESFWS